MARPWMPRLLHRKGVSRPAAMTDVRARPSRDVHHEQAQPMVRPRRAASRSLRSQTPLYNLLLLKSSLSWQNILPKQYIEFVRIANMCEVTGMEPLMTERIKAIIIANPAPGTLTDPGPSELNNTYCLISEPITSAADLPDGHLVHHILAAAAVEGYLRHDDDKFSKEIREVHNFSVDLLNAVKATLKTLSRDGYSRGGITVKDPL